MRLLVHVLARLAITANFTNSAAALDVQAGSPEISFLICNLSEYPMLNSQSAIAASGVTAPRNRPRELRASDSRDILPEQLTPARRVPKRDFR